MKYSVRLTKGGKTVIDFGKFKTMEEVNGMITNFLNDEETKLRYRVKGYLITHLSGNVRTVDFGDYSNFIEIEKI